MEEIQSFFVKALGANPYVRVIDYLLQNKMYDFTKTDVAEGAKVSRMTLDKVWNNLESLDMIVETRRIGNAVLYAPNKESEIMRKFAELDHLLTLKGTEAYFGEPTTAKSGAVPIPA
jgi:hypothetical protein